MALFFFGIIIILCVSLLSKYLETDFSIKVILFVGVLFSTLILGSALRDNYRMLYWVKTDATVVKIDMKLARIDRNGPKYKDVYTIAFKVQGVLYEGTLTEKVGTLTGMRKGPKYRLSEAITILVNPENSTQIDFLHKNYNIIFAYILGIGVFTLYMCLLNFERLNRAPRRTGSP